MGIKKKSFVLYSDCEEQIAMLTDEQAGKFIKAIFAFANRGEILSTEDGMVKMLFSVVISQIVRDNEKYINICRKRAESGKKGGTKQKQAKESFANQNKQKQANKADNDNGIDNDNEIDNDNDIDNVIDIDTEIDIASNKFGEYQNVIFTDSEYNALIAEFPDTYQSWLERLSSYMASTGKSYKNHLATIKSWAAKEKREKEQKEQKKESACHNPFLNLLNEERG